MQLSLLYLHFTCLYLAANAKIESPFKPITGPVQVGKLKLSPIGAGTWSWGNKLLWDYKPSDDAELREAYQYLVQHQVNWFDTADSYGTGRLIGRSESLLGQFKQEMEAKSKSQAPPSRFTPPFLPPAPAPAPAPPFLCTKLAPFPWVIGDEAVSRKISQSSLRLGGRIDVLQFHWPPSFGWQEDTYVHRFHAAVRRGDAGQIGLSNFGPKALERVKGKIDALNDLERGGGGEVGEKGGERGRERVGVYSNQVQFSLLSFSSLQNGLAEACARQEVRLIGYSPLSFGLLSDTYSLSRLPRGQLRSLLFREYLSDTQVQALLSLLRAIAQERGRSVSEVVLNWSLRKGIMPLVGVRSVRQAREAARAGGWALSEGEVEAIDRGAERVRKPLPQNFNQSA